MGKRSHLNGSQALNIGRTKQREIVTQRLESASINLQRFIDVKDGRKQSFDHDRRSPDEVSGNYGVYCGEGLLGVDIDDYKAWNETPGAGVLPETFTVSTPHGGEHRYYRVASKTLRAITAETGGSLSPSRGWGELYGSKYLIGPGSEIQDCGKPRCTRCSGNEPSRYEIETDRPIAEISIDEIAPLLRDSPEKPDGRQASVAEFGENTRDNPMPESKSRAPAAGGDAVALQLRLGEEMPKEPDRRILWRVVSIQTNSCRGEGARFDDILDQAKQSGIDCFRTARIVRSWLKCGDLRRAEDPNRVIPQREK